MCCSCLYLTQNNNIKYKLRNVNLNFGIIHVGSCSNIQRFLRAELENKLYRLNRTLGYLILPKASSALPKGYLMKSRR